MSNADIAQQLAALAQLLTSAGENPFKIKAYRRAAETIRSLGESVHELIVAGTDLTGYSGIGKGIAGAIREIAATGTLRLLDKLRETVAPELAALSEYPRLDPRRVQQIFQKLGISSVAALREKLESGEIARAMGPRIEQHVRQAMVTTTEMLLYDADDVATTVRDYLLTRGRAKKAEVAGDVRRRVEVVRELRFVMVADDFARVVEQLQVYGGRSELLEQTDARVSVRLPIGLVLSVENTPPDRWGLALLLATGSEAHLAALEAAGHEFGRLGASPLPSRERKNVGDARGRSPAARLATEKAVYAALGLPMIPPELREGIDEVALAERRKLPTLIRVEEIRGDLHMHTNASDGAHTLEQMVAAAKERGYSYIGIADHSQSLKIAGGVSEEALWRQIRRIDALNAKLRGFRVLKSAEVDIRVDGTLDYPDELLRELDYTVCSIHSKFGLDRERQTERILRAMDNPYFTILGHATGRLLLRRPGYQIDFERVIAHAQERGCCFEINASPDRLDLSAEHARMAREAGVKIAINTDAHSTRELDYMRCGIDVARRAGLEKRDVLNCLTPARLAKALR